MKFTRSLSMHLAVALLLGAAGGQSRAADWQKVLSDRGRTVEIDRASIFDSDRGTKVSWGRVVLSDPDAKAAGYRTIKALNRYDCLSRSFFTIKRVYLDIDERVLKEESVSEQTPIAVAPNTADERMWREVCRPPGGADLQKAAEAAGKAAEAAGKAAAAATAAVAAKPAPAPAVLAPPPKVAPVVEAKKTEVVPKPVAAAIVPAPAAQSSPATPPAKTPPPQIGPARAVVLDKPIELPNAEPTPAAMPIPSIRPNLAALAAQTQLGLSASATSNPAAANVPPTKPTTPAPTAAPHPKPSTDAPPTAAPVAATPAPKPAPPKTAAPPRNTDAARSVPRPRAKSTPAVAARPSPQATAFHPPKGDGWSYTGDTGPDRWGTLRPDWKLCSDGMRQSPIDLRDGVAVELDPVKFDYRPSRFRITNTGNMLRVNVGEGMGMEVRGQRYTLEYFTLHRPSEERVGGGASDMVVHFHHRDGDGQPAMLGVLVERGEQANPLLQTVLNHLPLEKGSTYMPEAMIDLGAFLPADPGHFLYMGSLSTPPCTEGVLWVVMKEAVTLSTDQLAIFSRLHPRNSRPIQPTKGRLVLESLRTGPPASP